ncbi:MAG TPA: glycosyltransferase [Caulobacteraceae bacterium]|nr:glycosyltransferase [Caulobacteraceae bacterium]
MPDTAPTVSVIMANYNGGAFVEAAIRSVLAQTLPELELLFADDLSADASLAVARRLAAEDARVIPVEAPANGGPAAARNRALERARGRWIAVVDSDDLIHPDRLRRLVEAAEKDQADIVADDLMIFGEGREPEFLFRGDLAAGPVWITAERFVRSNRLYGREPALGYCKPVIRAEALKGVRYDESLRIAEDFDLLARLLIGGAKMLTVAEPLYFYRKHPGSISHRLSESTIAAIVRNDAVLRERAADRPGVIGALDERLRSLRDAEAFDALVEALKRRRPAEALKVALRRPAAAALLRLPVLARLSRLLACKPRPEVGPRDLVLLSRQRVVGATNGSSAYLLSIAEALGARGWRVRFVGPSPKAFGRWPVLKLKPETAAFAEVRIRGSVRLGPWVIATDPRIALRAGLTVLEAVLAKLKLKRAGWVKPAPYAVAEPATRADLLFAARHAAGAKAVLADYAFLTPLIPYALAPEAPSAVVMHDLFSSRAEQFARAGASDSVAAITADEEYRLLGQAGAVVAIQAHEAEAVRAAAGVPVIVAPMAARPVAAAQAGEDGRLLFVGSNTAPNVVGLQWFFREVWPRVRAARPGAVLEVAGNVNRAVGEAPDGVGMLGLVDDLDALYSAAGMVVSPLITGSGLKIKLVEAMAKGKAIVATPVTAQGVEAEIDGAVFVDDDPAALAAEIVRLLDDAGARAARGEAALERARRHFSAEACYAALLDWFESGAAPTFVVSDADRATAAAVFEPAPAA